MSESFLQRLSRFTPDAGSLQRDALLFAAGRGSARPGRGWKTLAMALAGTQSISLALLWPQLLSSPPSVPVPVATRSSSPVESRVVEPPVDPGMWSAASRLQDIETDARPAEAVTFVDNEPPLRAFATPPASIVN